MFHRACLFFKKIFIICSHLSLLSYCTINVLLRTKMKMHNISYGLTITYETSYCERFQPNITIFGRFIAEYKLLILEI